MRSHLLPWLGLFALVAGCKGEEAAPTPTPTAAPSPAATAAAPIAAGATAQGKVARETGPIKVGILHSLSGTMAISETSLKDVALMTVDAINVQGGLLGKPAQAHCGGSGLQLAALRRKGPRS